MTPFYYDIVCPYAYMAFKLLQKNRAFQTNLLELKPILLGGLFKELGSSQNPNQTMPPVKAVYIRHDIERQAAFFGVPLHFNSSHPVSSVKAMRLLHACDAKNRELLTDALYQAYWVDKLDIDDDTVINSLAQKFNLGDMQSYYEHAKAQLTTATSEAFSAGVFGVPTIIHKNQRYFGADRLYLLQQALSLSLPDTPWPATNNPIDFYFDFSSPYSYLAFTEVHKAMRGGTTFTFKPILLGAIFKELGVNSIPMLSAHPNKTKYFLEDMTLWAKNHDAAFTFSSHFPIRTVLPLRVSLQDPNTIAPLFFAAWAEDQNIGDPAIVHNILSRAGFDADRLIAGTEDDLIKNRLKDNTAEAISRGVFGVPTFFVGNEKVFGQDRFPWIKYAVSGQI